MTLARLVNYVDGNILTGPQLNAEFDNILNNGAALVGTAIPTLSRVIGLQGSIVSNIGSFQALSYQLRTTSQVAYSNATSSFSVNTQTAGPIANGKDQAAAFASTQVHFYAITTGGNSTNVAGIVSTNPPPTGPTLPAGYLGWTYLMSAIYTVATSIATRSVQVSGSRGDTNQVSLVAIGTATTATAINCGSAVPTIARQIRGRIFNLLCASTGAGGTVTVDYILQPNATVQGGALIHKVERVPETVTGQISAAMSHGSVTAHLLNLETTPTLYYSQAVTAGSAATAAMDVAVSGYIVPNGDV